MTRSLRLPASLFAACALAGAIAGVSATGARAALCATSVKLGFGPYLEKEPPSANFELRGVVHPACTSAPRGTCVGESLKGGKWQRFETVPVLPSSGRCRFILSLASTFNPTKVRVRFVPAAFTLFRPSSSTIVLRDDANGPFPADRGNGSSTNGGSSPGSGSSGGSGGTKLVGIVFLDTAALNGGPARVPPGAKVYPLGPTISGAVGCQTTPTNGQLYLVFDYAGAPTAGELRVTYPTPGGGSYQEAPIPIDVNAGRTVQFLGLPTPQNGRYQLSLQLMGLHPRTLTATFRLARSC